ncbi:DUF6640 family protein [Microbacterium sp. GXF7504]
MYLTAQILLTVATLGYSLVPVGADLNETHAKNPLWTAHARFHVVWQVVSYVGMAVLALVLIWTADGEKTTLHIAAVLAACAYGGFFAAVIARPAYGGSLEDVNGYPRFEIPVGRHKLPIDLNVLTFSIMSVVLIVAWVLIFAS